MLFLHTCLIVGKVAPENFSVNQVLITTPDNLALTDSGNLIDKDKSGAELLFIRDMSGKSSNFGLATKDGRVLGIENNKLTTLTETKTIEKLENEIYCKIPEKGDDPRCQNNKNNKKDEDKKKEDEDKKNNDKDKDEDKKEKEGNPEDDDEDEDEKKEDKKDDDEKLKDDDSILQFYAVPNDPETWAIGVKGTNTCLSSSDSKNIILTECPKPGFGGPKFGYKLLIKPNKETKQELLYGALQAQRYDEATNSQKPEKKTKTTKKTEKKQPPLQITRQQAPQQQNLMQPSSAPIAIQIPNQIQKPRKVVMEESSTKDEEESIEESSEESKPKEEIKIVKVKKPKSSKKKRKHRKHVETPSAPVVEYTPPYNPYYQQPQYYQPQGAIGVQIHPPNQQNPGEVIQVENLPQQSNVMIQQPQPENQQQQPNNENESVNAISQIASATPMGQGINAASNLLAKTPLGGLFRGFS